MLRALEGDIAGVQEQLAAGVAVDACATWTETEQRWFYEKSWDWKRDTALTMVRCTARPHLHLPAATCCLLLTFSGVAVRTYMVPSPHAVPGRPTCEHSHSVLSS